MSERALVVCNHPGGARSVLPVVDAMLRAEPKLSCELWMTEHSYALADVPPERVNKRSWSETIDEGAPDLRWVDDARFVLTGTSISGNLETTVIRRARAGGIPVFSVLDHWADYGRRFRIEDGRLTAVPDVIFVPDDSAREDLLGYGVPPDRLIVLGHPAFDHLGDVRISFSEEVRDRVLGELGVSPLRGAVVFVSEPVVADHGHIDNRCSEEAILRVILEALRALPDAVRPALVVKLHPRERHGTFDDLLSLYPDVMAVVAPLSMDRYHLLLASNLALGIDSIMLIEAAALGVRAFSITAGAAKAAAVCTRTGLVGQVADSQALQVALRLTPRTPGTPVEAFSPGAASSIGETILARTGTLIEPVTSDR